MKPKCSKLFITLILVSLSITSVMAQTTLVPTEAPSKTPNPIREAITLTPENPKAENSQPKITPKTQADLSVLTGNIQRPNGLIWFNDRIYAACTGDWTVYEIDIASGSTSQYIYGVKNAHSLHATTTEGELHLWIPDFQNNNLTHIYRGTAQILASNLEGPWGIAELGENQFAVTNLSGNNVVAVTSAGETKEIITGLRSPTGIATDSEHIYVANTGSARRAIEWFDKNELTSDEVVFDASNADTQVLVTGLQNTTGLALGEDRYLYFSYSLGTRGVVGRVEPEMCRANGGCSGEQVEIVLYTELAAPLAGLSLSPDMRLYIHSIFSPEIYWVDLEPNGSNDRDN